MLKHDWLIWSPNFRRTYYINSSLFIYTKAADNELRMQPK